MKTKTNETLQLPALATVAAKANEWLHRENRMVSFIMEERVSNLRTLHYVHIGVPALLALCCGNLPVTVGLMAYSATVFLYLRKGGAL